MYAPRCGACLRTKKLTRSLAEVRPVLARSILNERLSVGYEHSIRVGTTSARAEGYSASLHRTLTCCSLAP